MDCREFRKKIDRYIDGEMADKGLIVSMGQHVDACDSCRALLQRRRNLISNIQRVGAEELALPPMETYIAQLRDRIETENPPAWWLGLLEWVTPSRAYLVGGFAVAVLLFVLAGNFDEPAVTSPAMPESYSRVDYLEVPAEDVSALTYVNDETKTTVVWLTGVEVKSDSGSSEERI